MLELEKVRNKKEIKQEYIASQIGKKRQTISNWERGISEPNLNELIKLKNILNCSFEELLGLEDEEKIYLTKEEYNELQNIFKNLQKIVSNKKAHF